MGRKLDVLAVMACVFVLALTLPGCEEAPPRDGGDRGPIPDVVGMSVTDALDVIGTRTELTFVTAPDAVPGTVVTQDPAPGSPGGHDMISYITLAGPVAMPDVVGLEERAAWDDLKRVGIVYFGTTWLRNTGYPGGTVASQSPGPGTPTMGDDVLLTIAGPIDGP